MSDVNEQVTAVRTKAACCLRPEVRTLELTGDDRVEFLNGMLTNDVAALAAGEGQRAIKTNNKGRIEAYVRVRAHEDRLQIDCLDTVADRLLETLRSFVIMEEVELQDVSSTRDVVTVLGPEARDVLGVPELAAHAFVELDGARVIRDHTMGPSGYELHVPAGTGADRLRDFVARGAIELDEDAREVVRVEAGAVKDGVELDLDTFPMEARLESAISFTKGCYVGQEVIARGTNLGQVNHLLVGWRIDGEGAPAPGELEVLLDDKVVGEIDSTVWSNSQNAWIGLGYVRREHAEPGTPLVAKSGADLRPVRVCALPFVASS